MNVAGLILAGGASQRMGTAKALLDYRGETFLDRLIRIFGENCRSVTVVLGHDLTIESRINRAHQARFVANPDFEKGQLSSLQCGLRAVPSDADAVLFIPVDYPAIGSDTVEKLISAAPGNLVVVPEFDKRHGHPVLFDASLVSEFLALPPESEARTVIRRHVAQTAYVEVADPGVLRDVDDPEAYAELKRTAC